MTYQEAKEILLDPNQDCDNVDYCNVHECDSCPLTFAIHKATEACDALTINSSRIYNNSIEVTQISGDKMKKVKYLFDDYRIATAIENLLCNMDVVKRKEVEI